MKTLTTIERLVLNETLDDAESLEQIYRALAFELSEGDSQSHAPNAYYWRESRLPILLADIADAINSLVAKKLLIVCQDPADTSPPEDLSYIWRSWFQASSEGRILCGSSEPNINAMHLTSRCI
jgi:hypothetical protein